MRAGCVEVDPPGVRFSFVSHMAGLYFHIPFCRRICAYCDFFKSAEVGRVDSVLDAMGRELDGAVDWLADRWIRTVYFGGGTPSLCDPARLQGLADRAATLLDCSGVEEFTVEANPDDMTEEWLEALARTGANRLSVGVQSFDDDELRLMNRRHTGAQAVEAVRRAQAAGFANLTIDLIFGVPGFGGKVLQRNLEQALALGVQHISAYHLTVEKNTAFGRRLERGRFSEVDEQVSEREYLEVHRTLTGAGFEHYEVSNYALPGCRARHNAAYWSGDEYLGIGPAAHSFNGKSRRWAAASIDGYLAGAGTEAIYEQERLTERDRYNEYLMTRLRTAEGLELAAVETRFGKERAERLLRQAEPFMGIGELCFAAGRLAIPAEKFLVSDAVIGALFEADD